MAAVPNDAAARSGWTDGGKRADVVRRVEEFEAVARRQRPGEVGHQQRPTVSQSGDAPHLVVGPADLAELHQRRAARSQGQGVGDG